MILIVLVLVRESKCQVSDLFFKSANACTACRSLVASGQLQTHNAIQYREAVKKCYSLIGRTIKALPHPLGLHGHRNFFFSLSLNSRERILTIFSFPYFCTKIAQFLENIVTTK